MEYRKLGNLGIATIGLGTGVLVMEPLKKGRYVKDPKSQPDLTPLAEYGIETWAQVL